MVFGKKDKETSIENENDQKNSSIFGRAKSALINAVDQNSDGTLDINDVSILKNSVESAAKRAAVAAKDSAKNSGERLGGWLDQTKREMEMKTLRPIFEKNITGPEFSMTKMIRVADIDKKHAESEVCQGSIGFVSEYNELSIISIFTDKVDLFGVTLYPDRDGGIYYIDPCDRDRYIAIDSYFHYLKVARVNELQRIAQELGAKYFKVTYKEALLSENESQQKLLLRGKQLISNEDLDAEHRISEKNSSTIEVSAEMECIGHAPTEPQLVYFQNDDSVKNLIRMRMSDNAVKHQKFSLYYSHSSGIKVNDAVKIDLALKAMKYSTKASVTSQAQSEARRFFEYEISF